MAGEKVARDDVEAVVEVVEDGFEFGDEAFVAFFVVGGVGERDFAVAVDGDAVFGIGEIFIRASLRQEAQARLASALI